MRQKVPFSYFCIFMTVMVFVLVTIGLVVTRDIPHKFNMLAAITAVALLVSLFYCPLYVVVTDKAVEIHRPLKIKTLPLNQIKSVETFYPSPGGLRLCGSGGFAGYWGYFNDIMCGSYFGYYGKRDSCFLVKMNDGRQYVVGCENPKEMVDYLKKHLRYEES